MEEPPRPKVDSFEPPCYECPLLKAYAEAVIENVTELGEAWVVLPGNMNNLALNRTRFPQSLSEDDKMRFGNLVFFPEEVTPAIDSSECRGPKRSFLGLGRRACRGEIRWLDYDPQGGLIDRLPINRKFKYKN